jgi:3-phenylpropionate/trans-cinnamate dioxygenase ferredoxin reductase subunit
VSRPVVIVGGGLAGQRCAEALRRGGFDGRVRLVCAEPTPPYDRPPLSKELLAGERDLASLRLRPDRWYDDNDVELLTGRRAAAIDPHERNVVLQDGARLTYDRLVVATGAGARTLPELAGRDNVLTLRDAGDATVLAQRIGPGVRLLIVGGGFIGLEVASTASGLGAAVTVLEAAPAPLACALGAGTGHWFARLHRRNGIDVRVGARIAATRGRGSCDAVELGDGGWLQTDVVLVAVGAVPDTRWLARAGLDPDGVVVGPGGACAVPGILAAGDAARPVDPFTGRPGRREHWESAARSGTAAARCLLGHAPAPEPPAGFWSDQHGIRINLVGDPSRADRTTVDGDLDAADFAVTYWRRDVPVAVLLAGRPDALPAARALLADPPTTNEKRSAA